MRILVVSRLREVEERENVRILLASESGSRAWGFPSTDSDYDVRFVYIRRKRDYLAISESRDTLDYPINESLDLNGWDVRKVLRHIGKSNPVMFEWLSSPVKYVSDGVFIDDAVAVSTRYYSRRASLHHYMGICKNSYEAIVDGKAVKYKKIFYVVRPLLASLWIVRKDSIPPMDLAALMEGVKPEKEIIDTLDLLRAEKETSDESGTVSLSPSLLGWIDRMKSECESYADAFPKTDNRNDELTDVFIRLLETRTEDR